MQLSQLILFSFLLCLNLGFLKSVSVELLFDCAAHCVCDSTGLSVTCASSNLTAVPGDLSADVRFLNLSSNGIVNIGNDDFTGLNDLEYVDLSYNGLINISDVAFERNERLRTVLLSGNFLVSESLLAVGKAPLHTLSLGTNQIRELDQFFKSSSLVSLDLSENEIHDVPLVFLKNLPNLEYLSLAGNQIETVLIDASLKENRLKCLNLSRNSIAHVNISAPFESLDVLDLSWNALAAIDPRWFVSFPNVTVFIFSGNPIDLVPEFAFMNLWHLQVIEMNFLRNLTNISRNAFHGLNHLNRLDLANNPGLTDLDADAMSSLTQLRRLDLSNNDLRSFHLNLLSDLTKLEFVDLSGNLWSCNCLVFNQFLGLQNALSSTGSILKLDPICGISINAINQSAMNYTSESDCRMPRILGVTKDAVHKVGSSALLDCVAVGHPMPQVIWITNRNETVMNSTLGENLAATGKFFQETPSFYYEGLETENRMFVLPNGSLYIVYVTRKEGGTYRCLCVNENGNDTMAVKFRLDYEVMSLVAIKSIILGFLTAAGFFLIAVIIGIARYLVFVCSKKERKKRKSIREVLELIQDYKTAQFDRFSAYRTAKMDQLSAFKSAKIDQLSAFKHARVDKLRTYKQASVTSILHYLERMREHYTSQTARIKDNCAQQMDRLRENYGARRGRFKDYRSHQVERMRENYNAQVLKIREYGVQQMSRLREQYKSQQQNVLKLLELLDIGNCVTVIEAECMHTESVIFDASIAFDFEAHAIHVPRDNDSSLSEESHYLTASESSSDSNDNIPLSLSCTVEVEPHTTTVAPDDVRNSPGDLFFESIGPVDVLSPVAGEETDAESERETEC